MFRPLLILFAFRRPVVRDRNGVSFGILNAVVGVVVVVREHYQSLIATVWCFYLHGDSHWPWAFGVYLFAESFGLLIWDEGH